MPSNSSRREFLDTALSVSAAVVALSALVVSAYQAKIAREQQKMSAWPRVYMYNTGSNSNYGYIVQNVGVGPALVRSATLAVDGRYLRTWTDVLAAAGVDTTKLDSLGPTTTFITSSVRPGSVLLPGVTTELLRTQGQLARPVYQLFHSGRLRLRVCYCSVYRDCWVADSESDTPDPAEVAACPNDPGREFRS